MKNLLSLAPRRIGLAHLPTPIRKLNTLSGELDCDIWLKSDDQSGFALSGNKVRKLEFLLADALANGAKTVITCGGIQSNHCRATAFACAQLGLNCHLILRNDVGFDGQSTHAQANHFLDVLCGASCEIYEPSRYQTQLDALLHAAAHEFAENSAPAYVIPTGGSNGVGVWGYVVAVREIQQQCNALSIAPEYIVCATGSGGTQAGLSLGVHAMGLDTEVQAFAVCDSAHYFEKKVKKDIADCLGHAGLSDTTISDTLRDIHIHTNADYIGPGYAKADKEVYQCIRDMAKKDGILLDPTYTGKAFLGMLSEITDGQLKHCKSVMFVHTGGAFGLLPHARWFNAPDHLGLNV